MESKKQNELKEALCMASKSVLILAIAGMAANFFAIIPLMGKIVDMCNVLIIAAITAFMLRLECPAALVDEPDAAAFKKIRLGINIFLLGFILNAIPAAGAILGMIGFVVAYIFLMMGFNLLKKSESFPFKDGMSLIFIAMILGIVGSVLTIIPLIGIIGKLCLLASYLLLLLGWKKVTADAAN